MPNISTVKQKYNNFGHNPYFAFDTLGLVLTSANFF